MNLKLKNILFAGGIALGVTAVVVGATAGLNQKYNPASAAQYSLLLDEHNSPSELPANITKDTSTITTSIQTNLGNSLTFNFVLAKASTGNFVQLANNGYFYNFGAENGRIKGINAITATFTGSLKAITTNSNLSNGGAFLGEPVALPSGTRVPLTDPVRYFELKAGDSGATITSLLIEYTCYGNAEVVPTEKSFTEDFNDYSETGVGYDTSHGINATTGLRAEYYSTYRGISNPDPSDGTSWSIMGSSDYLTLLSSEGRNSSKCGLFKVNSTNSFKYFQTKALFGVNSIIGKGNRLSFWAKGAYTGTDASSSSSNSIDIKVMAFYNGAKYNTSGSNSNIVTTTHTIAANSNWTEYTLTLDKTKDVYAYGFCLVKASGTAYVPIDDISIYTEAEVSVTGVSLNKNAAEIEVGGTTTLTATVMPNNATNKNVSWSSSNNSVATVDNTGLVTGVATGNATITVTTEDGGLTATCAVTVAAPVPYPTGSFRVQATVLSKKVDLVISIGTRSNGMIAVMLANTDAHPTSISYDNSTKKITIPTTGSYSSVTFGTITATYDDTNDRLTNIKCDGEVSSYVSNNGKLTATRPTVYNDCDGTTTELQSQFKRRWNNGSWQVDTSNGDRIARNTAQYVTGSGSAKLRGYSGGAVALVFNSDFASAKSVTNVHFWVYNPSNSDITLRMWYFKAKNLGSSTETGSVTAGANGWTYLAMGFGTQSIYNFQIADFTNSGVYLSFDSISLF